MAINTQIRRKLDKIWRRWTAPLLRDLGMLKQGPPLRFDRRIRDREIEELLEMVTRKICKEQAWRELKRSARKPRLHRFRGFGWRERSRRMLLWADGLRDGPMIYSFWKGRKCLYVGKGGASGRLRALRSPCT